MTADYRWQHTRKLALPLGFPIEIRIPWIEAAIVMIADLYNSGFAGRCILIFALNG